MSKYTIDDIIEEIYNDNVDLDDTDDSDEDDFDGYIMEEEINRIVLHEDVSDGTVQST